MRRFYTSPLKNIPFFLVLIAAMLTLAACGGETVKPEKNAPPRVEKKIKLGKADATNPNPERLIQTADWGEVPANQIAIILKGGKTAKDADTAAEKLGGKVVGEVEYINLYQIETGGKTEADLKASLDEAAKNTAVETAFPNVRMSAEARIQGITFDPLKQDVYSEGENGRHNEITGVRDAWTILKTSGAKTSEVSVGIADEPFYEESDELGMASGNRKRKKGGSTISGDTTTAPERDETGQIINGGFNHGTMVAHVIGANPENGGVAGVAGVLGDKLKIYTKNVFDAEKEYTETVPDPADPTIAQASNGKSYTVKTLVHLKKLIESGSTIINCSFGTTNGAGAAAYKNFFEKMSKDHPEVLFVASAGNSGIANNGLNHFPGGIKLPNLITVGAVNNDGSKADFSNSEGGGGEVSISAPAVNMVLGVGDDGKAVTASGTSFASPQVAAAAAMIRSINPKLTASEIKKLLSDTASPGVTNGDTSIPLEPGMGAGVLNIADAVLKVVNDMRADEGLKPLSKDDLLALGTIELWADGEGAEYRIEAILDRVGDDGAEVRIDLSGEGAISGKQTKTLGSAGTATWDLTLKKNSSATVNVKRLDSGAWGYILLVSGSEEESSDKKKKGDAELTLVADPMSAGDQSGIIKDMDIEIIGGKINISVRRAAVWLGRQGESWAEIKGSYNAKTMMLDAVYNGGWNGTRGAGAIVQDVKIVFTGKAQQKVSPRDKKTQIYFNGTTIIEITGAKNNPPISNTKGSVGNHYTVEK